MKVLLVSQYYWPETFAINGVVRALRAQGCEVTVLTGKPNYPEGAVFPGYRAWGIHREVHEGSDVLRLPLFPRGKRSPWRLATNYLSFIGAGWLLGNRLLQGRSFDVVFVYAPSPLLQALPAMRLAHRARVPLVLWVQDLWPESLVATGFVRNRSLLAAVAVVVKRIYRACDAILIQSEAFREPVARLAGGSEKIHYHPNSVELPAETEVPTAAARVLSARLRERFSVVFAGNLGTAQSLETIVEAAKLLRERADLRIVLVGSGSLDTWLKAEIERLQLANLELAGRLPPQDMPWVFESASALLVTLRPDPALGLTVPSKVQAYLAAGRPIVAALDGEGARVVEASGAGHAVPSGDAQALATAIARLQDMSESERHLMGERGRAYSRAHFEPKVLAERLVALFTRLKSPHKENGQ